MAEDLVEIIAELTRLRDAPKNMQLVRYASQPQMDFYYAAHKHLPAILDSLAAVEAQLAEARAKLGPGGKGWAERAVRMERERDALRAENERLREAGEGLALLCEAHVDDPLSPGWSVGLAAWRKAVDASAGGDVE